MTSSSRQPGPIQLFDLCSEILHKILREYLSSKDKLRILWTMTEFRPFLENRGAWIVSVPKFSVSFLDLIHTMKPGRYCHKKNKSQSFLLKLDPEHMRFYILHFIETICFPETRSIFFTQTPKHARTYRIFFERMKIVFKFFLKDYDFVSEDTEKFLLYASEDPFTLFSSCQTIQLKDEECVEGKIIYYTEFAYTRMQVELGSAYYT